MLWGDETANVYLLSSKVESKHSLNLYEKLVRSCRKEWIMNETQICIVLLLCLDVNLLPYLLFPSAFLLLLRFSDLLLSYENPTNLSACSHLLSHWPTEPLHNKPLKIVTVLSWRVIIAMLCVCIKNTYKLNFLFPNVFTSKHFGHLVSTWKKTRKNVSQLLTTKEMYTFHDWIVTNYINFIILQ